MTEEEIIQKFSDIEGRVRSNTEAIKNVTKKADDISDLIVSVKLVASELDHTKKDVSEIKADVKSIKEKPAQRWENLIGYFIAAVAGAFFTWLASGAPGMG